VARLYGPRARGQQPEPVVKATADLVGGEGAQAGGGQLDRQRLPVEPSADLEDGRPQRRGHGEPGRDGGAALAEEAHGVVVGEGVDGMQHLTRDRQRFAAGGEDPQARDVFQQGLHEVCSGVDEMLAVVEQEQELTIGEGVEQAGGGVGLVRYPGHDLGGADGVEHGRGQPRRIADRRQFDHDALAGAGPHDLAGQPRLPGAARPGQRHQPVRREQADDPPDVRRAAHEAGERGRRTAWTGRSAQHGEPGGVQRRTGVDPELVGEPFAGAVEL
jgi:hypothetical protein